MKKCECKDCMWWTPTRGQQGVCEYETPRPVVLPSTKAGDYLTVWPETPKNRTCRNCQQEDESGE